MKKDELLLNICGGGGTLSKKPPKHSVGFTLAEMMVVMLIMSIVMAAMAPVMTTRMKSQSAEDARPWQWTPDKIDAYLNSIPNGRAIIGQHEPSDDDTARLIINTSPTRPDHILFKVDDNSVGQLTLGADGEIQLGSNIEAGSQAIAIGAGGAGDMQVSANGTRAIALGRGSDANGNDTISMALDSQAHGGNSIAIGANSRAGHDGAATDAELNAIAIGFGAYAASLPDKTNSSDLIAIGTEAGSLATDSIAIGHSAISFSNSSIAIGSSASVAESSAIAIGSGASAGGESSIAIGQSAWSELDNDPSAAGKYAITIGRNSRTKSNYGITLGSRAFNSGLRAIAIGSTDLNNSRTSATGENSIAVGYKATATQESSLAIGTMAEATGPSAVAFGYGTKATGSRAIYIGRKDADTYENFAASGDGSLVIGNTGNSTGTESISIGVYAQSGGDIGNGTNDEARSIAIGYLARAMEYRSIAIGTFANVHRKNGIAIGDGAETGADRSDYGDYGIAIGEEAKAGSDYGISIGYQAGNNNSKVSSGNIAIGARACENVTGSSKICIGTLSGPPSGHEWADDGEERIFIGSKSNFNDGPAVLEVHNVGGQTKKFVKDGDSSFNRTLNKTSVVINGNLIVKGGIITSLPWSDNQKWSHNGNVNLLGRSSGQIEPIDLDGSKLKDVFGLESMGTFASPDRGSSSGTNDLLLSDRRLKYVGTESKAGLDKIRQLKVFNYTFKKDEKKTPHVGVIAQDLQKIFPDAVTKGDDGFLRIRLEDMFYAIINAIKELDDSVRRHTEILRSTQSEIKRLKKENQDLKKRLEALEAKVR